MSADDDRDRLRAAPFVCKTCTDCGRPINFPDTQCAVCDRPNQSEPTPPVLDDPQSHQAFRASSGS